MLAPDTILQNRYRIVRELGHGGMGTVYEAIDQRVSSQVALKEMNVAREDAGRGAFEREAALLANLRHQSLPKVMDYFSENAGDFLVMEFVAGYDLAELLDLRGSPFPQSQVLRWADELLRVLEYLHGRESPILHRDIKPSNLKLTKTGEIFLLDFGLAKGAAGQMPTLVTDHSVRGHTRVYAPLEQILSQGTDVRSDIFSLAATLYHVLTGVTPIDAPRRFHQIEDGQPDPLKPIEELNPQASKNVAKVIEQAMGMSRKQRPSSAAEMRKALRQAAEEDERSGAEEEFRRAEERRKQREEEKRRAAKEKAVLPDEYVVDLNTPEAPRQRPLPPRSEVEQRLTPKHDDDNVGKNLANEGGRPFPRTAERAAPGRVKNDPSNLRKEEAQPAPVPPPRPPSTLPFATMEDSLRIIPSQRFKILSREVLSEPLTQKSESVLKAQGGLERSAIIGVAFIVLILAGAYVVWMLTSNTGQRPASSQQAQQPGQATEVKTNDNKLTPPPGMVYVLGGEFTMGRNDGDEFERPAHRVKVEPFFIDQYEVTNEDYSKFIRATAHRPPASWQGNSNQTGYPQNSARKPVTGVTWDDANAYAKWAKKQLPTEQQWECAARGADGRRYPWGDDWGSGMANAHGASAGIVDVGTHKGASPFGAYDMIGNVWEWTSSEMKDYPGGRLPEQPQSNTMVARGGNYISNKEQATTTYRLGLLRTGDASGYTTTGFRCVKSVADTSAP